MTLFCLHDRLTFPLTLKGACTVTCLQCGAKFEYDWETMKRGKRIDERAVAVR